MTSGVVAVLRCVLRLWRTWVMILTPLLALIVPLRAGQTPESWCGYTIIIMAIYWMTEVIPIQATALLPVVLFPLTGTLTTKEVSSLYMNSANMLFLGGLIVAAAVEHSNLHLRIALRVLIWMGSGIKWLILGFMLTTMFLSMWISNTAATAMMTPIIGQIISILLEPKDSADEKPEELDTEKTHADGNSWGEAAVEMTALHRPGIVNDSTKNQLKALADRFTKKQLSAAFYIAVAYAANCGGTGTLTGTGPNLVLVGQLEEQFGPNTGMTYATFMMFGVPTMLTCTLLAWLWLIVLFFGVNEFTCAQRADTERFVEVRRALQRRYDQLGSVSFHQKAIMVLFSVLVVLWLLRDPKFIPGWLNIFPAGGISDATPAMLIVVLMFMIPARPRWFWRGGDEHEPNAREGLVTWKAIHTNVPWGVLVLLGGGFALARGSSESGLSLWVGQTMSVFFSLPPAVMLFVICLFTAMITEICSNTATATILMPVLGAVARETGTHPIYLMLPAAITTSYAFMLPVATPPNAIVHEAGQLRTLDMVRAGLLMNLLCVGVVSVYINTLGVVIFDLNTFPVWANVTNIG